MEKVKERRISNIGHVRNLLTEQINQLRLNSELDPILRARAIGYLSNIFLTAYSQGEAMEKLEEMEQMLRDNGVIQ